jgi:hypothetical protein
MKNKKPAAVYNPFKLRAGSVLQIVNPKDKVIGSLVLREDTDILLGFCQKDEQGSLIKYKTMTCVPDKGIYRVREEI